MINKYFTTTIKPGMTASIQHAGTYLGGSILFDWTPFQIPKGASKLTNVTLLVRGTNGVRQERTIDLYFAKSIGGVAPSSLGTERATAGGYGYQNHLITTATINAADYRDGLDIMSVGVSGGGGGSQQLPAMVIEGEPNSGTNVGYDTIYVSGIPGNTLDWRSTCETNNAAGAQGTHQAGLIVSTTSALLHFDKGDVVYDEDDRLIGTVKRVTDGETIVFEDNLANASVDNKDLYVHSPITIILSFEK
tara:strand:- start:36 stop:779 length:744 start_codon:yes stop_codon:yes gene_type:complete